MGNSILLFESGENKSCFKSLSSCDNEVNFFLIGFGDPSKIRISKGDACECSGSFDINPNGVVTLELNVLSLLTFVHLLLISSIYSVGYI